MNPDESINSWVGNDFKWRNPDKAKTSDNQYAYANLTSSGHVSNYLKVSDFGFSVPAGATITGIQVSIERKASSSNAVQDHLVRLVDNTGAVVGSNYFRGEYWPATDAVAIYGGETNLWGTTWTPEQVNDADFGVVLSVRRSPVGHQTAYVDNVQIKIAYDYSDTTSPTLNLPANITTEATNSSGAMVSFVAIADDANPAHPVVTCNPVSGSTFPIGTTTVACSATDTAGNIASGSFTVTVQDTTPPVISGMPANINTKTTDPSGKIVTYVNPTANDAVDGDIEVNCIPVSGSIFPIGTTVVTCSASDSAGNTSNKSFNIKVELATGTIKVVKDLHSNLSFDSGRFNLLIDETVKGTNKGDNGTTGTQTVITGAHSVSEEGYGATDLADYTSSIRCTRQEIDYCHYGHCHYETVEVSSGQGTSLSGINVGEDEDVTCTIQNTRNTGTIKVVKNLNPSDDEGRFNLKTLKDCLQVMVIQLGKKQ